MQDSDEPTSKSVRARMDAYIAAACEGADLEPLNPNVLDEIAKKFLETLTPMEMGFLMHDDPQPVSLQELDSDTQRKYRSKYGTKNLKRGQFFVLKSGSITFFSHEHNLKFKVGN
jgi:hypothetical protein